MVITGHIANHGLETFDFTDPSVLAQLLTGFGELSFQWIQFSSVLRCARSILFYFVWYLIGYIVTGSLKGRGKQYIWLVKGLYCKLPNSKQLPALPHPSVHLKDKDSRYLNKI